MLIFVFCNFYFEFDELCNVLPKMQRQKWKALFYNKPQDVAEITCNKLQKINNIRVVKC